MRQASCRPEAVMAATRPGMGLGSGAKKGSTTGRLSDFLAGRALRLRRSRRPCPRMAQAKAPAESIRAWSVALSFRCAGLLLILLGIYAAADSEGKYLVLRTREQENPFVEELRGTKAGIFFGAALLYLLFVGGCGYKWYKREPLWKKKQ